MGAESIVIRPASSRADFDACIEVQRLVWGLDDVEIIPALQLIATSHFGGMTHVAEDPDIGRIVGFAYAFAALSGTTPHIHSDMLAVLPEYQKRGVGVGLKWAQRATALERGIDLMTWTFDPLQARNAHLNLHRLGAVATRFFENFYGITSSKLHHGLPTDRLLIRWELKSPRVASIASGAPDAPPTTIPALPRINEIKWQAGWPVSSEPRLDLDALELLLEIPPEWDVLSRAAPSVAQAWHGRVRAALRTYLERGYICSDFLMVEEMGRRRPLYVLKKSSNEKGSTT